MEAGDRHPLDRFVDRYWADRDAGEVRALGEYLEMFPGDDEGIAAEFVDLRQAERRDLRQRVGPCRLVRELGYGGQATVWLAEDTRVAGRRVALNLLNEPALAPETRERLRREAEAASRLNHPNICALHDAGLEDAAPWIAVQFIEGVTLARLEETAGPIITRPGDAFGTPPYMAPEQIEARADDVGAATDVWALGITLHECLTDARPFDRDTRMAMQKAMIVSLNRVMSESPEVQHPLGGLPSTKCSWCTATLRSGRAWSDVATSPARAGPRGGPSIRTIRCPKSASPSAAVGVERG